MTDEDALREKVRESYSRAASAVLNAPQPSLDVLRTRLVASPSLIPRPDLLIDSCTSATCCADVADEDAFGATLYGDAERAEIPSRAAAASLGCGNPIAVAELREGERVVDLGSGGGIDVLLSARRVGPTGFVYGVDMTDEMLALARANAAEAEASNVAFLKGTIEAVPLPDASADVVISNCVINLSTDKRAAISEMFRVLTPGGRIGILDVVAEDHLTTAERAERGSHVGCIAGALSRSEYLEHLGTAGFTGAQVEFVHNVAPEMHAAIIRATRPGRADATPD